MWLPYKYLELKLINMAHFWILELNSKISHPYYLGP